jgi:hypothetical protein
MGKFKPVRPKTAAPPKAGAIPCIVFLVAAMVLVMVLFYYMVKG